MMEDSHKMVFYTGNDVIILFEGFHVTSSTGLALACCVLVLVAALSPALRQLRQKYATLKTAGQCRKKSRLRTILSRHHLIQTCLFLVDLVLAYLLMLVVMSFNVWLFGAVVAGLIAGTALVNLVPWCRVPEPQLASQKCGEAAPCAMPLKKDDEDGKNTDMNMNGTMSEDTIQCTEQEWLNARESSI